MGRSEESERIEIRKISKNNRSFLLVSLVFIGCFKPLRTFISSPKQLVVFEGQQSEIASLPVSKAASTNRNVFTVSSNEQELMVNSHQNGEADMVFQLAGFPVKKVNVKVLKDFKVIPGGQSIGVKLNTIGVLVVGHHLIQTETGKYLLVK